MELSFVAIGVAIARSAAVVESFLNRLRTRREKQEAAIRIPEKAVADPLSGFWSEFDLFLAEHADVPEALEDLRQVLIEIQGPRSAMVITPPSPPRTPSGPRLVDLQEVLRKFRREPRMRGPDPLRRYLEGMRRGLGTGASAWNGGGARAP